MTTREQYTPGGSLSGTPIGGIAGSDAMRFGGWQRLNAEYAKQFDMKNQ